MITSLIQNGSSETEIWFCKKKWKNNYIQEIVALTFNFCNKNMYKTSNKNKKYHFESLKYTNIKHLKINKYFYFLFYNVYATNSIILAFTTVTLLLISKLWFFSSLLWKQSTPDQFNSISSALCIKFFRKIWNTLNKNRYYLFIFPVKKHKTRNHKYYLNLMECIFSNINNLCNQLINLIILGQTHVLESRQKCEVVFSDLGFTNNIQYQYLYFQVFRFLYFQVFAKLHFTIDWPEAVVRQCSVKKVSLEISQNSQENTCVGVSFCNSCRPFNAGVFLWILQNF